MPLSRVEMYIGDALSPQYLEISPEFPDFPDFEFRSPEQSHKSGISLFLHGKVRNGPESLSRSQRHIFHFNLCEGRVLAPLGLSESKSVRLGIYLLNGMAAEFWITQFTQVAVYARAYISLFF